jgi:2-keto-4-pentenoate hydratase
LSDTSEIAQRILRAYSDQTPIEPIRGEIKGVAAAYAVQQAVVDIWKGHGRKIAGQKIGLTSKAVQDQLGVKEPDFGTLFADMILEDGATVAPGAVSQPRIEGEIAFILKSDLRGTKITPEEVIAATDYVCPAIEICGSRIARWDIKIEDTIADNASSGLVVVGKRHTKPVLAGLADAEMSIRHNGAPAGAGRGQACLGNPAIAVAWLAEALTRFGEGLRAGDLVMSGSLAKMIAAEPGDKFDVDFGALGTVSVTFGA